MNFFSYIILILTAIATSLVDPDLRFIVALLGIYLSRSPRQVAEWERGVLLRFGRFKCILQSGISWIIPGVDKIEDLVDMRIRSTSFSAEKALTQDTVPVNVDAVLFWEVTDAQKAVTAVEDFSTTINWAAQTTLRDVRFAINPMPMLGQLG